MVTATYDNVAQLLMREHASGTRYHPLSPETGVTNLEAAYAVQRRYVDLMGTWKRFVPSNFWSASGQRGCERWRLPGRDFVS